MSVNVRFWDWLAKRYARMPLRNTEVYEEKLARTLAHLTPDAEVLEFGCGTGTTALFFAAHAKHVKAIDCSTNMVAICREKAEAAKVANLEFAQSGIEDLPDSGAAYDMVMAHNVLHLLEDRAAALTKVHHILRPGGVFVSSTACAAKAPWLFRAILKVGYAVRLLPLFHFLTEDRLKADIKAAGFDLVEEWLPPGGRSALFVIARKP